MIILEGPDRCGKTTVANLLNKLTGWKIQHFTNPDKLNPPITAFKYFNDIYETLSYDTILDRSHISNDVYSKVYKNKYDLSNTCFYTLEEMLGKYNPLVVILTDTPENIKQRWSEEEMYSNEKISDIVNEFKIQCAENGTCTLNICSYTLKDVLNENKTDFTVSFKDFINKEKDLIL